MAPRLAGSRANNNSDGANVGAGYEVGLGAGQEQVEDPKRTEQYCTEDTLFHGGVLGHCWPDGDLSEGFDSAYVWSICRNMDLDLRRDRFVRVGNLGPRFGTNSGSPSSF